MTSNLGSDILQQRLDTNKEHAVDETARQQVMDLLKRTIRPEFLNRVDEIIMFTPLGKEEIREVVRLQVKRIVKMLEEQGRSEERRVGKECRYRWWRCH